MVTREQWSINSDIWILRELWSLENTGIYIWWWVLFVVVMTGFNPIFSRIKHFLIILWEFSVVYCKDLYRRPSLHIWGRERKNQRRVPAHKQELSGSLVSPEWPICIGMFSWYQTPSEESPSTILKSTHIELEYTDYSKNRINIVGGGSTEV